MDKYEYQVCADQIKTLISERRYAEAMNIADTIDWRKVRSVSMLCTVSEVYKINKKYEEARDILFLAYDRYPGGRTIVYALCELAIKLNDVLQAKELYEEYVRLAPEDTGKYILLYKLYEALDVSLEERIEVLEEFKKRDYRERWAYELAYLYHKTGQETRCVQECDELILWFGDGRYVKQAMDLKMQHTRLSKEQQLKYEGRQEPINDKFMNMQQTPVQQIYDTDPQAGNPQQIPMQPPIQQSMQPSYGAGYGGSYMGAQPMQEPGQMYMQERPQEPVSMQQGQDMQITAEPVSSSSQRTAQMLTTSEIDSIQVQPVNVGMYNTMDLQNGLSENIKKFFEREDAQVLDDNVMLSADPESYDRLYENSTMDISGSTGDVGVTGDMGVNDGNGPVIMVSEINPSENELDDVPGKEEDVQITTFMPAGNEFVQAGTYNAAPAGGADDHTESAGRTGEYSASEELTPSEEDAAVMEAIMGHDEHEIQETPETPEVPAAEYESPVTEAAPADTGAEDEGDLAEDDEIYRDDLDSIYKGWEDKKRESEEKRIQEAKEKSLIWTSDIMAQLKGVLPEIDDIARPTPPRVVTGADMGDVPEIEPVFKPYRSSPTGSEVKPASISIPLPVDEIEQAYDGPDFAKKPEEEEVREEAVEEEVIEEEAAEEEIIENETVEDEVINEEAAEEEITEEEIQEPAEEESEEEIQEPESEPVEEPEEEPEEEETPIEGPAEEETEEESAEEELKEESIPEEEPAEEEPEEENISEEEPVDEEPEDEDITEEEPAKEEPVEEEPEEESIPEEEPVEEEPEEESIPEEEPAEEEPEEEENVSEEEPVEEPEEEPQEKPAENKTKVNTPWKEVPEEESGEEGSEEAEVDYSTMEISYDPHADMDFDPAKIDVSVAVTKGEFDYLNNTDPGSGNDIYFREIMNIEDSEEEVFGDEKAGLKGDAPEEELTYSEDEEAARKAAFEVTSELPEYPYESLEDYGEVEEIEVIEQPEGLDGIMKTNDLPLDDIARANYEAGIETEDDENDEPRDRSKKKHPSYMKLEKAPVSKRDFDKEEQLVFGRFEGIEWLKAQIVNSIDNIDMDPSKGNVLVMGTEASGRRSIAIDVVKVMQSLEDGFKGKVAKISGEALNKKDIPLTIKKLRHGALIIENSEGLTPSSARIVAEALELETEPVLVVMEGDTAGVTKLINASKDIFDRVFNSRIELQDFTTDDLVAYGKGYAREKEYAIDEMGVLALYRRIGDMQTLDHIVTLEEVREIVDNAIKHVDKKNMSHFVDVLLSKRYDDDDYIILREKDFIV